MTREVRDEDVYLGQVNSPLCPVAAVVAYMAGRGARPGPFFIAEDGTPLTKGIFCVSSSGAAI